MDNEIIDIDSEQGFEITNEIRGFLQETAKWAKFIAIVGFIGVGLMVLGAISFGSVSGSSNMYSRGFGPQLPTALFIIMYLVMALLYFFPIYYLYNFSIKMKTALASNDRMALSDSFQNLKSLYKFMGITLIVVLSIYVVVIIGGIFVASALL